MNTFYARSKSERILGNIAPSTIHYWLSVDRTRLIRQNKAQPERIDRNEGYADEKIPG